MRQSLWVFVLSIFKDLFVIFISLDLRSRPGFVFAPSTLVERETKRKLSETERERKRLIYFETVKNNNLILQPTCIKQGAFLLHEQVESTASFKNLYVRVNLINKLEQSEDILG